MYNLDFCLFTSHLHHTSMFRRGGLCYKRSPVSSCEETYSSRQANKQDTSEDSGSWGRYSSDEVHKGGCSFLHGNPSSKRRDKMRTKERKLAFPHWKDRKFSNALIMARGFNLEVWFCFFLHKSVFIFCAAWGVVVSLAAAALGTRLPAILLCRFSVSQQRWQTP